jgi:ubiquinone biosynthesis protein
MEELGPVFVKFGQALSTRRDLLPVDIADELAKLQDRVPPFAGSTAIAMLERIYGKPVTEVFSRFETAPLAAASIAQVHAATLNEGGDVVVKLLRPGMREIIDLDLQVLQTLAELADRYWVEARQVRPVEVVREYRKTILDELDLMREAANAAQLKRNFAGSTLLYVPAVHWDYCRINVMVMERIHGIIVSQVDELRARGANIAKLAENGVEIFFTQVFRHNFFHADMHPGNIFVQVIDPQNPRYAAVDFGIVGTLQPRDQHYLAENFLAFFDRDYGRIARLHIESEWVPRGTRVDELESAVRTVCEPIFNKPLKEISFAQVLLRLFETARRFDMQVQPQLILLQKTLFNIEGLGRQLYPELDLWKTARPVLAAWMRERISPRNMVMDIRRHWPDAVLTLRQIPGLLKDAVRDAGREPAEALSLDALRGQLAQQAWRREVLAAAAVLWLSGMLWLALAARLPWVGWLQIGGAGVLLLGSRMAAPAK